MKKALGCTLLLCSVAFAQDAPYNAAAEALKKRLDQLKLINPPKPVGPPKQVIVPPQELVAGQAPKVCSVPLLNVLRANTGYNAAVTVPNAPTPEKMPVVKPNFAGQAKDFAVLPAPPCEQR